MEETRVMTYLAELALTAWARWWFARAQLNALTEYTSKDMRKDGLLHISQIAHQRVNAVTDFLSEGQKVKVQVIEVDDKGRVRVSAKALIEPPPAEEKAESKKED